MVILRSLAFNTIFYANLIVQMILWTPYYFLSPRHRAWFVPKFWARTCVWLHETIAGARAEIEGVENLPAGSFILAPKFHVTFTGSFGTINGSIIGSKISMLLLTLVLIAVLAPYLGTVDPTADAASWFTDERERRLRINRLP